ncbi:von Willebrand factor type A domain-containing protein [Mycena galericulata]|nr:von Willebrand factor type A domain-containing protein [Mycena galericulata]
MSCLSSTLKLLLRMLPCRESIFNIFSFGSRHSSLWPRSTTYSQQSLDTATSHVGSMGADYGGTEIRAALNSVFACRERGVATAVFVLTDGEVTDYDTTISDIQRAVSGSTQGNQLRVFCLGIGDGVSSAMCEGIARAWKRDMPPRCPHGKHAGQVRSAFPRWKNSFRGKCHHRLGNTR